MIGRLATVATVRFLGSVRSPLREIINVAELIDPVFICSWVATGRGNENVEKCDRFSSDDSIEASGSDRVKDVFDNFFGRRIIGQCVVMLSEPVIERSVHTYVISNT